MGISEALASIPSLIADVYDLILCLDSKKNEFYVLNYKGDKIKVSESKILEELNNLIKSTKVLNYITMHDTGKSIVDDKLVVVNTKDNFKLVFIGNLKEESNVNNTKKVILIADDSPVITKFFTKTFQDEYEILVANDGVEAIRMIEEKKDIILAAFLDLQMPNKNGYEVLEYFKENDLFKVIPVSIISGEDSKDGIAKATSIPGVVDMLLKPFSAASARAIVNKTISFSPKYKEF